jgi:uncharacterized membrane protein
MAEIQPVPHRRRALWGSAVVGFALGGFFDGILLHQVLQWHHLFSLVPGEQWRDIRNQILMDGWFHVLHYLIAFVGLYLLWSARAALAQSGAKLLAAATLGFSVWQFVDVVGFHWVLMIHRIRVGVPNPLAYDLGWLAAFGATSLALGLWLWRRPHLGGGQHVASGLTALALLAGPAAAMPPRGPGFTVVLFRAGSDAGANLAAAASFGRVLWASGEGDAVAFEGAKGIWALRLYVHGAVLVGSTPVLGGCVSWARSSA